MVDDKQKELQEKYFQLQVLDSQIQQLQKQHKLLEEHVSELVFAKQGLDDLSRVSIGSEILAPFSSGIFVKGVLSNNSEVVVNVGSNVAVKKNIPDAIVLLDSQLGEVREAQTNVLLELSGLTKQAMILESELRALTNI
jgi:prefoldin alpha subunit